MLSLINGTADPKYGLKQQAVHHKNMLIQPVIVYSLMLFKSHMTNGDIFWQPIFWQPPKPQSITARFHLLPCKWTITDVISL